MERNMSLQEALKLLFLTEKPRLKEVENDENDLFSSNHTNKSAHW